MTHQSHIDVFARLVRSRPVFILGAALLMIASLNGVSGFIGAARAEDEATLLVTPVTGTCSSVQLTVTGAGFLPSSHVTVSVFLGDSGVAGQPLTTEPDGSFQIPIPIDELVPECRGAEPYGGIQRYGISADTGHGPKAGEPFTDPSATTTFTFYSGVDRQFQQTWMRNDKPVADDEAMRTWTWGPGVNAIVLESYADAPEHQRFVRYFDKSRMEVTDPNDSPDDPWSVTNGLLVVEMVEGRIQEGDTTFDERPQPAMIPVAGDPDSDSITYADIQAFGLRDMTALSERRQITWSIDSDGTVVPDDPAVPTGVTAARHVDETDHTVASPFWDFMTSDGIVWEGGEYTTGPLFQNPFYATGYPITEAYWSRVKVAGVEQDVLWQCFERRCLTFTPTNITGWKVEAGNVGRHYFDWRY